MVQNAYAVLKDDKKRLQWERDQLQGKQAAGGKSEDTFGEDFAPNAYGNETFDKDEFLDEASPNVQKLLSAPGDRSTIKALKAIDEKMRTELERSGEPKPKYKDVKVVWETIQDLVKKAQVHLRSKGTQPENKEKLLRLNKKILKDFVQNREYPDSWYQSLPPEEEPEKPQSAKTSAQVEEEPGESQSVKTSVQPESSSLVVALRLQARSGVLTRVEEPILGYSNVGKDHQFIVQTGTLDDPRFDLRSDAEIGFYIAGDYLEVDDKIKNHFG